MFPVVHRATHPTAVTHLTDTPSSWQAWITSPYYKELEKRRATNATLVKTTRRLAQELAEAKTEFQALQAQPPTVPGQSPETSTPSATPEQRTDTPSHQGTQSMDTAQDAPQEEKTTDPTPKKGVRTSSQNDSKLAPLEFQLEAKIEALANTCASTAAVTDQRLARVEDLITTSFSNIQKRFEFIEQTLKPIWNCHSYNKRAVLQQNITSVHKKPDISLLQGTAMATPAFPGCRAHVSPAEGRGVCTFVRKGLAFIEHQLKHDRNYLRCAYIIFFLTKL
ncbi:hypothetical protein HPB48_008310 [Haemaphysalis longicornis]|uniref:Uncharacterized protein n=1 Tax=Haemaphysalis longicornis TaxID=44386 RepID=A0A9J6FIS1_HAELO|nr:hypothetical protein HPB48_008310 [Haemaphysalis longicornis]